MAGIFCSRSSVMRRALLLMITAALVGCRPSGAPAVPDFTGTWGHQRVFGIDEGCGETLPDGSLRAADCPESNDAAPSAAAVTDFSKYSPAFAAKVKELNETHESMDTALRSHPPCAPRHRPAVRLRRNH